MKTLLRPYRLSDFDALYSLWQVVFDSIWPVAPAFLKGMVSGHSRYQEGDHLVAEQNGLVVGFAATQIDTAGKVGGIPLLMVSPEQQRQGIGTRLHTAAMEQLRQKKVETVSLAHGGGGYFWPGVPLNCPGAITFFESCGWKFSHTSYDLTQQLIAYQTPPGVFERAAQQGIEIRHPSTAGEAASVLDFEERVFPSWAEFFGSTVEAGRYTNILAAWDGTIVIGSLLTEKTNHIWHRILGDDMGTIGAVGIDDQWRGHGIGLALVARASEILRGRDVRPCLIGWTDELDFYGKVGYKIWQAYAMTENRL